MSTGTYYAQHQTLAPSRGGELGRWIRTATGEAYTCPACGQDVTIGDEAPVHGYHHADGLPDETDDRWWVYVVCPDCEYETTYDQLADKRVRV